VSRPNDQSANFVTEIGSFSAFAVPVNVKIVVARLMQLFDLFPSCWPPGPRHFRVPGCGFPIGAGSALLATGLSGKLSVAASKRYQIPSAPYFCPHFSRSGLAAGLAGMLTMAVDYSRMILNPRNSPSHSSNGSILTGRA
jgi:hypothetical protein